ncbi:MAG TPA: VOC family protein [Terriglobia bacterium]|nr:VOC family protein [Terriglobia bacterium]
MLNRRDALMMIGAASFSRNLLGAAQASELPLRTPGLEHLGLTVPDPKAAADFYGRIFNPQLFREKDPPARFYVTVGTAYLAFGSPGNSGNTTPRVDHFCALVQDYNAQSMTKALEAAGVTVVGRGMIGDPDGIRLQLLNVPGGLAGTIVPGGRISVEQPAMYGTGLDHITLLVSDLERSTTYYRKFFGQETSRTKTPARVWFKVANTRLALEAAPAGQQPRIDHFCFNVAGFDRQKATGKLRELGAEVVPSNDEQLLRFRDPNGIVVELNAG